MPELSLDQLKCLQVERASLVKMKDYINEPKTLLAVTVLQKNQKLRAGGILYDLQTRVQIDALLGEYIPIYFPAPVLAFHRIQGEAWLGLRGSSLLPGKSLAPQVVLFLRLSTSPA